MRVMVKNTEIKSIEVTCEHCKSILEMEHSDLNKKEVRNYQEPGTAPEKFYWASCPVCLLNFKLAEEEIPAFWR